MKRKQQKERSARQTRQKQLRALAFGVIVVLVLSAASYLLISGFASKVPASAANTIDLAADMGGFNLPEIRLKAGEPVTMRITSLDNAYHTDGGGKHQWAVDELALNVIAPPLGSNSVTFTPAKPGIYTFYCDICCGGRANPTMQGKLIIEA